MPTVDNKKLTDNLTDQAPTQNGIGQTYFSPEEVYGQFLSSENNKRSKGSEYSLEHALCDERIKSIRDALNDSEVIQDAYGNKITATGGYDVVSKFNEYSMDNDSLNYPLWLALYNESWVFRRAIDKPAQDMVRTGITITTDNGSDVDKVYEDYHKYSSELIQLIQWGALTGGSVGVLMFDNFKDEDYQKSIKENDKKVRESKAMRIYVTDRWYGCSPSYNKVVNNMRSIDYGKPSYYDITLANGKTIHHIHHDYVMRYENRVAPPFIKNGQLQGWGYAEGCHIINELMRNDQIQSAVTSLINKSLIEVVKMPGMRGVFMQGESENNQQLQRRIEMVNAARNYNSLTLLDKDDDYQQNQFSGLAGLSDILQQNMWQIASALEMQGVLFGDLKGGFSSDQEALERYDDTIQNRCENYFRPCIEKFIKVEYVRYGIKEKVNFSFNSMLMKKHDEDRMEGFKSFIAILSQVLGDGVITAEEYKRILRKYSTDGVIDFNFSDEDIEKVRENYEEELEGIDITGGNSQQNGQSTEQEGGAKPKPPVKLSVKS